MARLPILNADADQWGAILNEFLRVSHREDGTLKGICEVVNVRDFGAVGDGGSHRVADTFPDWQTRFPHATSPNDEVDWCAIQAAINSVKHIHDDKGSAIICLPIPSKFYRLDHTLDLTEIWNVTLICPARYFFQRRAGSPPLDSEYALLHWYGAPGGDMIKTHYTYGLTLRNISFNGRGIANTALRAGLPANTASNNRSFRLEMVDVRGCEVGIRLGSATEAEQDVFPIDLESCFLEQNGTCGLWIDSGNAGVSAHHLTCWHNGETLDGTDKGCNVFLKAGQLYLASYGGIGRPKVADICMESGGLRVHGAWSDVNQGAFLDVRGAEVCVLSGVRHYNDCMNPVDTAWSIIYQGEAPLVLVDCFLFNSVQIKSGNTSHVIDIGTQFIHPAATFAGDQVLKQRGYIGIGTKGGAQAKQNNEARVSIGRPNRIDVGDFTPFTVWSNNLQPGFVRSNTSDGEPGLAVTDLLNTGDSSYKLAGNAYYDGHTGFRSIMKGPVWQIELRGEGVRFFSDKDSTNVGEYLDFKQMPVLLPVIDNVDPNNGITDGSFRRTPLAGSIAVDSTNSRLYVRVGNTWKYVTLT